jgi:hypothetical protein
MAFKRSPSSSAGQSLSLILQRLDRYECKADAARSLGITREALYGKLKRLGAWPSAARSAERRDVEPAAGGEALARDP